jgi:hemerythrin
MVVTLLKWRDHYSVGAESVDYEHRVLIDRINRLDDQLMAEDGPLEASAFFEDLTEVITAHFAREERFMREHGYGQLPQHREDYERFLDDIRDLIDEFDRSEKTGREDLAARLDGWLSGHFETHDARLKDACGLHPA